MSNNPIITMKMNCLEDLFGLILFFITTELIKMNHLSFPPEKLYLRFQVVPVTTHKFTCFSSIQHNLNLVPIHDFLCSTPSIRLQNIWNWITKHWNNVHEKMSCEPSFRKSHYYEYKYKYIHKNIDHYQLDEYLKLFVKDDPLKALFAIQCLFNYVFP